MIHRHSEQGMWLGKRVRQEGTDYAKSFTLSSICDSKKTTIKESYGLSKMSLENPAKNLTMYKMRLKGEKKA